MPIDLLGKKPIDLLEKKPKDLLSEGKDSIQSDLSRKVLPQLLTGIQEQVPFGRRIQMPVPIEQMPQPSNIPARIARQAGRIAGMSPSFAVGGLGSGAIKAGMTKWLGGLLPTLLKYIISSVTGAKTFGVAHALRNIGQNRPLGEGVLESAQQGAIWGPAGEIKRRIPATIASAGLGAITGEEGQKLESAILFGGMTAIMHQRPQLSKEHSSQIDQLYKEATFTEGLRTVKDGITQRQKALPVPETIYGEGFSAKPSVAKIPVSIQKQLGFRQPPQLEYKPTLEKGQTRQGEGFTVTGVGKGKGGKIGQILRTTPTPEETIQTVAKQEPKILDKLLQVKAKGEAPKTISTPQIEVTQTKNRFYAKIRVGEKWKTQTSAVHGKERYASMTSQKAIDTLKKSLKNVKIRAEGEHLIIEGEGGFVNLDFLTPAAEYISKGGSAIYRGLAPAGEVMRNDKVLNSLMTERQRKIAEVKSGTLPEGMKALRTQEIYNVEQHIKRISQSGDRNNSFFVEGAADAVDAERTVIKKFSDIVRLGEEVGITRGSKASEIIFKALDYRRATPQEIATLTSQQQKFIPIFRNAYKEIWEATGKPSYEGIRDYATHLINDGLEKGYDISPFGRFLPDELYSRFFEKRKGGKPYKQDIVEAFDTYVPSVARKTFREPLLQEVNEILPHLGRDMRNEVVDYMEAFLGRGKYGGGEPMGNLSKDLVRLTYQGTLHGNFSAATKNATQVLTNTIPEIGVKNVMHGYKRLMTKEGRAEFLNSKLAGEVTLGHRLDELDFFSHVEFVNRGVSYLGAKQAWFKKHPRDFVGAENYAKRIVRDTQFIQTGVDVPKLYRHYGALGRMAGQFAQFPTKQGFLILKWVRNKEFKKLARFATYSYLLGGSRAFPFLDGAIEKLPDDQRKLVRAVEKYTSLAGLSGMDIGQNFGFGIYERGFPVGRGPALGIFRDIGHLAEGVVTRRITTLQDIIRSRLFQRSLPTAVPGGVAMKKIIDYINADVNDYKIRNAYNQLQYTSTPKEETLRILVGPTKERRKAWHSMYQEQKEDLIYRNDHRKMLDYVLDSQGDVLGLEEFIKKYPTYDINNLFNELEKRAKDREMPADLRHFLKRPKVLRYLQEQQ